MYDQGYISKKDYEEAVAEELDFVRGENSPSASSVRSYYTETVISDVIKDLAAEKGISELAAQTLVYNAGYEIYCCLDKNIQAKVDKIYEDLDALPKATNGTSSQLQSGIVIMDQYTGKIVALSGGTGKKTINFGLNRATKQRDRPDLPLSPLRSTVPPWNTGSSPLRPSFSTPTARTLSSRASRPTGSRRTRPPSMTAS